MPTKDPDRHASGTPLITVEPTEVGFGAVEVGITDDLVRTIHIRNTNGINLVIGGIDISDANGGDFSLVDPIPVTGTELWTRTAPTGCRWRSAQRPTGPAWRS